jgi:hypothetical protein
MLLFFVLIYVGIVGALIARLTQRSMGFFRSGSDSDAQQIPLRG